MVQRHRRIRPHDAAVSDLVGTLLLVVLAVSLGAILLIVVSASMGGDQVDEAHFVLVTPAVGAESITLRLVEGRPIVLSSLEVTLARGDGPHEALTREAWGLPHATHWEPGQSARLPLSPGAGAGESFEVRIVDRDANRILVVLGVRVPESGTAPTVATLAPSFAPDTLPRDGVTTTRLEVRVSHPDGALAVASLHADLEAIASAAGSGPLHLVLVDDGTGGDRVAGDGTYSTLVRAPPATPLGTYAIKVRAVDASGLSIGEAEVTLGVTAPGIGLPTSAGASRFALRDFQVDAQRAGNAANDYLLVRVSDGPRTWSAIVDFTLFQGAVHVTQMQVWHGDQETIYRPTAPGNRVPVAGLTIDMIDPTANNVFAYQSGAAHPQALYPHAQLSGTPRLVDLQFGDASSADPRQVALVGVEVDAW